jgi:hypothetical protein
VHQWVWGARGDHIYPMASTAVQILLLLLAHGLLAVEELNISWLKQWGYWINPGLHVWHTDRNKEVNNFNTSVWRHFLFCKYCITKSQLQLFFMHERMFLTTAIFATTTIRRQLHVATKIVDNVSADRYWCFMFCAFYA